MPFLSLFEALGLELSGCVHLEEGGLKFSPLSRGHLAVWMLSACQLLSISRNGKPIQARSQAPARSRAVFPKVGA